MYCAVDNGVNAKRPVLLPVMLGSENAFCAPMLGPSEFRRGGARMTGRWPPHRWKRCRYRRYSEVSSCVRPDLSYYVRFHGKADFSRNHPELGPPHGGI